MIVSIIRPYLETTIFDSKSAYQFLPTAAAVRAEFFASRATAEKTDGKYGERSVQGGLYTGVGEVGEPLNVRGKGGVAKLYQLLLFEGALSLSTY